MANLKVQNQSSETLGKFYRHCYVAFNLLLSDHGETRVVSAGLKSTGVQRF